MFYEQDLGRKFVARVGVVQMWMHAWGEELKFIVEIEGNGSRTRKVFESKNKKTMIQEMVKARQFYDSIA